MAPHLPTATGPSSPSPREICLHALQGEVFRARYRYKVAVCGRRWGKTTLGKAWLIEPAYQKVRLWYIAPTYRLAHDIIWREMIETIPPDWYARRPNQTRLEIELKTGALLQLKGADDPDSLRGRGVHRMVIDEYADMPDIWAEVLAPSLVDTQGEALFLGTPKGYNHFHTLYKLGLDSAFPEWHSWRFPTRTAPHIKPEELEAFRRTYPAHIYRQEFEAEFEARAGMIVGPVWEETHTVTERDSELLRRGLPAGQRIAWHVVQDPRWRPPEGALIYGSVDYGYGAPWSFHLHAAMPGGHTRTFFERYETRVQDIDQARIIREDIAGLMKPREFGGCAMSRPEWIVLDPSMKGSRHENGLAKSIYEVYQELIGFPLNINIVLGAGGRAARLSRPNRWLAALATAPDGLPWWSVTTACPNLIRTVPEVPWDEDDPEVEDDDSENHAYEDVGRFFEARPHAPIAAPPDPYAGLDPMSRRHHQAIDARLNQKPSPFNAQSLV